MISKRLFCALYANANFRLTGFELTEPAGPWNRFIAILMCNRCGYSIEYGLYEKKSGKKVSCPSCLQVFR